MSLRLVSFASISALLLIASAPAFAQDRDTAVIQTNTQGNVTTGNGNTSINESKQIFSVKGRIRSGNTGVVQGNAQMNDTQGNNGLSVNTNAQEFKKKYGY